MAELSVVTATCRVWGQPTEGGPLAWEVGVGFTLHRPMKGSASLEALPEPRTWSGPNNGDGTQNGDCKGSLRDSLLETSSRSRWEG
jgi:hypothetical protein